MPSLKHYLHRRLRAPNAQSPDEAIGWSDEDERNYLRLNPDVKRAVEGGTISSGYRHYLQHGRGEGRADVRLVPRQEKLLGGIDVGRMSGMEIGPLTSPIVGKEDGQVIYVDHADTETLRRIFSFPGFDTSKIVPIDFVWGERTLRDCVGEDCRLDYVVNSHVIEHVPDLVTWLAEIHSVLKPGGLLRMAIPDRRYTFDILRRESSLADALDAYVRRTRVPLTRAILDHFLHYVDIDAAAAWEGRVDIANLQPKHPPGFAIEVAERFLRTGEYQDTHCWVFTPHSIIDLFKQLAAINLLQFELEQIYPTDELGIEFVLRMRAVAGNCEASWQHAGAP